MSEKPILVTGCSSGIGLCVADGLKQRGYRVFATARNPDDVDRLTANGHEALQLDIRDSKSINQAVDEILLRTENRLYALFNNAGYGQPGAVEDLPGNILREQFETNFFGTFDLTNRIIPVMRKQGHGRLIFNSSVLGFAAMRYRGAYNASKFAMEGLCDTLRMELENTGIHISIIEPGPITSRFRSNAMAAFMKNIDRQNSHHKEIYAVMEARLTKKGPAVLFTQGPEAVLNKVIHSLESDRPRVRYYVTFPTYLFAFLRHILPYRAMDWVLKKAGA
ncbi:MAG: SDR family oxidoreductase [Gammaproteobacteria bacterium]|nr:MAG: SDR family oxidoreductase [Gammaproteobacteria bacterium]